MNRTYALSKAKGKKEAIVEAEKLGLVNDHLYHSLLGKLYTGINNTKAMEHFQRSLELAKSDPDKTTIINNINRLPVASQ